MLEDRIADTDTAETESFDVQTLIRTLAGQDTEAGNGRAAAKRIVAFGLVGLALLKQLLGDEPIAKLRSAASDEHGGDQPADTTSSGSRSTVGKLVRLAIIAALVGGAAYAVRKRRGGDSDTEQSVPDETERDITDTSVAEEDVMEAGAANGSEDVMETDAANGSDVDEMVETVEDEEGEIPPEPGETVVEDDIVEAVTEAESTESGETSENAEATESVTESEGDSDEGVDADVAETSGEDEEETATDEAEADADEPPEAGDESSEDATADGESESPFEADDEDAANESSGR